MAIAYDAFSSPSAEGNDPSWTHTPAGTPRGVLVFVFHTGSITSVTYGSAQLELLETLPWPGSGVVNISGSVYFLGEGVPTGAQTVTVTTGGISEAHAGCFTVTAAENVLCTIAAAVHDASYTSGELATGALALGAHDNFVAAAAVILGPSAADVGASTGWTIRDEEDVTLGGGSGGAGVFEYANRGSLATGNFTTPGPFTFGGTRSCIMLAAGLREAAVIPVGLDAQIIWNTHVTLPEPALTRTQLQTDAEQAIRAAGTRIIHQVDIYEPDGETLWRRDAAFVSYNVPVDAASPSRRTLDLILYDDDDLAPRPGGLWYDKIVKVQRGVHIDTRTFTVTEASGDPNSIILTATNTISLVDTNTIETTGTPASIVEEGYETDYLEPVGVFGIDRIDEDDFPTKVIVVAGSDLMAGLEKAKFGVPTTFPAGAQVEHVVAQIAGHGGITRLRLHATGLTLGRDVTFESDTTCAAALGTIATDFGCEAYFDRYGWLVFRPLDDPDAAAPVRTYQSGADGDLARLRLTSTKERIYNDVVVSGESSDADVPPVFARAENTDPASPTHIFDPDHPELGGLPRRTYRLVSPFLTTEDQCAETAVRTLKRVALEDVEANAEVLVYPWLDEGRVVRIVDPNPPPGEPATRRYLLRSFSIGSTPGTHTIRARRVVNVG